MSKIMIWVGHFDTEADFEKYMDQTDFRNWWSEHDEDNKELSAPFCKELGATEYDEDFLIMKYVNGLKSLQNMLRKIWRFPGITVSLQIKYKDYGNSNFRQYQYV